MRECKINIFFVKIVFWLPIENTIVKPNENGKIKIIIIFLAENHDQAPLISSTLQLIDAS